VTTRRVHFQIEQATYERARRAAALDRRSLANWLTLIVERALEEASESEKQPEP